MLEIAVGNGWTTRSIDEDTIALEQIDGPAHLRYGHLAVIDATGKALPASMAADKEAIVLHVATAGGTTFQC